MLLLVLILVVIAFGLLVVALLSTSVLWAWVSVGVSVVAAVVLLVDWLQRRSAAKAGVPAVEQAPDPGSARPAMAEPRRGDLDPATEVLPVVPSTARGVSEAESTTAMAPAPQQFDAQQTVVIPAVQPSGSPARPPGADPAVTSSSTISSPNVTKAEIDRSAPGDRTAAVEAPSAPGTTPPSTGPDDADEPVAAAAPEDLGPEADAPVTEGGAPSEPPGKVALGKVATGATAAAAGTALAEPDTSEAAQERSAPDRAEREPSSHDDDATAPEPAAPPGPDAESTVAVEARPSTPADTTPDAPAADVAPVDATRESAVSAPAEPVDLFAPPATVDPVPGAEAPEEPRDPVAAEIVSSLDDEVVVVDEQPRYHVSDCRALVSVAVIPLPVREAVELGFTPCGWCSPDRTLAGRHQTAAR